MEEVIKNIIEDLTSKFSETIPETEPEKAKLVSEFKKYLKFAVKTIQESDSEFIGKDIETIKSILNRMGMKLCQADISSVKQTLLKDDSFEEIREKSLKIYDLATKKIQGKSVTSKLDLQNEVEEMKRLLESVKSYNKYQAEELVSEAIVDAEFLKSGNKNVLSIRLYHFEEDMKDYEDER